MHRYQGLKELGLGGVGAGGGRQELPLAVRQLVAKRVADERIRRIEAVGGHKGGVRLHDPGTRFKQPHHPQP